MTFVVDGGQEITEMKEEMLLQLERDPAFNIKDIHDLPKEEIRRRFMLRIKSLSKYMEKELFGSKRYHYRSLLIGMIDPGSYTRIAVHVSVLSSHSYLISSSSLFLFLFLIFECLVWSMLEYN